MDNTPSSKAIEFLAFQITQNKHNGPISHTTFLFLPTKEPLQPIRVSLTNCKKTQETPKKERKGTTFTPPLFFHSEGGGGQSTPHTFGIENTYLPKPNPSFTNGPRLKLYPTKPPTQRSLSWAEHRTSK